MDVYYNGNGDIWNPGKRRNKLAEFPVRKTFLWENQEFYLPAVYVGRAGAVLDICAKVPVEDMAQFFQKWDRNKPLSMKTQEELEQYDAENPCRSDFIADMRLNDSPLTLRVSSSLIWYADITQNDSDAERFLTAYDCDPECCWHFGRLVYKWSKEPVLSPQELSLLFHAQTMSITTTHFTTNIDCSGKTVKTAHPVTGKKYILTLHTCKQVWQDFTKTGKKGVVYPEYCLTLFYSVSPQPEQGLLSIRDCSNGDQPRIMDTPGKSSPKACASSAVFVRAYSENPDQKKQITVSSLYFQPVSTVQWRIVFQLKTKDDFKISFSIPDRTSKLKTGLSI